MTTPQQYYTCNNNICTINKDCQTETAVCFTDFDKCNNACNVKKPTSVIDYCNNPSDFQSVLSESEIIDYNSKCQSITGWDQFTHFSGDTIKNMFEAIVGTTTGREFLGLIFLKGALTKVLSEGALRLAFDKIITDNFLSKMTTELAEVGIKEVGIMTLSCLGTGIKLAVDAALIIGEVALPFLAPIEAALQMFMILGMLIDAWDPCDLKQKIGPEYLNAINKQYDQAFVNGLSSTIQNNLEEDLNKRLFYRLGIWPIEFYIDNTYIADAVNSINKQDYYNKKLNQYQGIYLKYATNIPEPTEQLIITPGLFKNLNNPDDIFYKLSNKNSVVENFFKKYWVYIIIVIILLIILFIFISNKLNKNVK